MDETITKNDSTSRSFPPTEYINGTAEAWIRGHQTVALVVCVSGVLGNSILATNFLKRGRKTVENSITVNLAVFDTLCGWHQIIKSSFVINEDRLRHEEYCELLGAIIMPLIMGSLFNYSLLALHHYLLTFKKTVFNKLFTRIRTAVLIATTWLLVIAFGVYFRFLVVYDETTAWQTRCYSDLYPKYVLVPSSVLLIAIFAIVYFNCRVYRRVLRLLKEITHDRPKQNLKTNTKSLRSVRSLLAVTTWLVVTYASGCLLAPLSGLTPLDMGKKMRDILFLVLLTNQANKPLVYLVMDGGYRASLKQMFRKLLVCGYRKQKVHVMKSYDHKRRHSAPRRMVTFNHEHPGINAINEVNPRE